MNYISYSFYIFSPCIQFISIFDSMRIKHLKKKSNVNYIGLSEGVYLAVVMLYYLVWIHKIIAYESSEVCYKVIIWWKYFERKHFYIDEYTILFLNFLNFCQKKASRSTISIRKILVTWSTITSIWIFRNINSCHRQFHTIPWFTAS